MLVRAEKLGLTSSVVSLDNLPYFSAEKSHNEELAPMEPCYSSWRHSLATKLGGKLWPYLPKLPKPLELARVEKLGLASSAGP